MNKIRSALANAAVEAADRATLVPLAGSVPTVPLDDIVVAPELQMRAGQHAPAYLAELVAAVRAGALRVPVTLFKDPATGVLRLADGHARVEAHRRAGTGDVPAEVRIGDLRTAFTYALSANATHGARRNNRDLRKAVTAALADPEIAHCSNTVIAELCACSDTFVGNVRKAAGGSNGSNPAKRVGKDGRLQSASKKRRPGHGPCETERALDDSASTPTPDGDRGPTRDLRLLFRDLSAACAQIRRSFDNGVPLGPVMPTGRAMEDDVVEAIRALRGELDGLLDRLAAPADGDAGDDTRGVDQEVAA